MRFKGMKFNRAPTVAAIREGDDPHLAFYRVIRPTRKGYQRLIQKPRVRALPGWNWQGERAGEPVYGEPIPLVGHSLTNMAYGKDGNVYLMSNGECWVANKNNRF